MSLTGNCSRRIFGVREAERHYHPTPKNLRRRGSKIIFVSLTIAAGLGLLLVLYLIIDSGASQVGHAMLLIGWWLIPITLFHLLPMSFSALSWRELIASATRLSAFSAVWIRWIRESINALLPVASIGGDVAGCRLAILRGVPAREAGAAMVVDTTVGVLTQLLFVLSGVALLLTRSTDAGALSVAARVTIAAGILFVLTAAFVFVQRRGLFAGLANFARRLLPERSFAALGNAASIDDAVLELYRNRSTILRASLLRLVGWVIGAGEVWLVMLSLGHPISLVDAFILESLTSGVRAAAFMIPGGLGALEGSFVVFGALFGLPADTALAISLSKRVRELALGVPGLFVWHWLESRYLLRRADSIAT
jgi:putative membrane protein